ncbi:MAG: response regulator transcription factor [Verrucomicrobiota bacterium]
MQEALNIQLVDDHPGMEIAIGSLLARENFNLSCVAPTVIQAINQAETQQLDAIILDLNLPSESGDALVHYYRKKKIHIPILIYTGMSDIDLIRRCLANGAMGCVQKLSPVTEFISGLSVVARDQKEYLCSSTRRLFNQWSPVPIVDHFGLTDLEMQIARLIAKSYSTREIAYKLRIGQTSVRRHRANLMEKTNAADAVAVTRFIYEHGLVME